MAQTPDWDALGERDEFRELVRLRRRFVVPAMIVFAVWFGGFLLLAAYAHDFMGKTPIGDISWAYIIAVSLIPMTWGIAFGYVRYADRNLTPLAEDLARGEERER